MGGDKQKIGSESSAERADSEFEETTLPVVQQNVTPCNIYQSIIPGVDPKILQHKTLSPRQMSAILLLLQGMSDSDVAGRLGMTRQTIFRWRTKGEAFRQELDAQRRQLWQRASDRLGAMMAPALNVLERQLTSAESMGNARIATYISGTILRLALRHSPPAPPTPEETARSAERAFDSALEAYINAPMPGRSRASALVE